MRNVIIFSTVFLLTACGAQKAIDATNSMPDKMEQMRVDTNKNMKKTNSAIHKQTLVVSLDNMLKDENAKYLSPPTGMLPGGQAFAEEANAEELVKLIYVFSREIAEVTPDDYEATKEANGDLTPYGREFDHRKQAKMMAMMVIAGLTPQAQVERIVADQIYDSGRFEKYAYNFLALRAQFIKYYLLEQGLISYSLTNVGMFEDALKYLDQLDYISKLPFASKIGYLSSGLIQSELNVEIVVKGGSEETNIYGTIGSPRVVWEQVALALETDLPAEKMKSVDSSRMQAIKQRIAHGLKIWGQP
jgi:hypothetical protein